MRQMLLTIFIAVLWAGRPYGALGAEPNEPNALNVQTEAAPEATAVVIPTKGLVDQALLASIRRRSELAIEQGIDYLIYEISTYGGLVDAADNIAKYLLQDVGNRAQTVAYVTTEAISAGALVSVSCNDIIMRTNTTIGASAPVTMAGTLEGVEREKIESFIRAMFQRAAEANGYPELPLKAMVTMQIEVWGIRNLQTGQWEFFESEAALPSDPNQYDMDSAEQIVGDSEILTLTASQALEYGVARAVVDDLDGALAFLEQRDGVVFREAPRVLQPLWSERMVSWLNSPAVMGVLVMLALLGVYIELSTPGLGLPGLVAVIAFAIIVGGKYLTGLANWVEIVFLLTGIILLLVELLLIPGFGIAGFLGIIFLLLGLFGILIPTVPGRLPWPETPQDWRYLTDGLLGFLYGIVGFAVVATLISRYLPKWRFMSGLILVPSFGGPDNATLGATSPFGDTQIGVKVGDVGTVISDLRPAGRARFGDVVADVVATAEFLDAGTKVEVVEVHGNRVVVGRVDTP